MDNVHVYCIERSVISVQLSGNGQQAASCEDQDWGFYELNADLRRLKADITPTNSYPIRNMPDSKNRAFFKICPRKNYPLRFPNP
jgi:hypothetical protein